MIRSKITDKHHFYVLFTSNVDWESKNLINSFAPIIKSKEKLKLSGQLNAWQLQTEIDFRYSSENFSKKIFSKNINENEYFLYDFFLGDFISNGKKINYFCFPYKSMLVGLGKRGILKTLNSTPFYKCNANGLLHNMKNIKIKESSEAKSDLFSTKIIKYRAFISNESNAKHLQLIGDDPLNSEAYEVINKHLDLSTTSVKLKCVSAPTKSIEIAGDVFGNFRFYIPAGKTEERLSMLPMTFNFLENLSALNLEYRVSSKQDI